MYHLHMYTHISQQSEKINISNINGRITKLVFFKKV